MSLTADRERLALERVYTAALSAGSTHTLEALSNLACACKMVKTATRPPLTHTERRVFSALYSGGPKRIPELSALLRVKRGTLHNAVVRLEGRGLLGSRKEQHNRVCWAIEGPL